MKGSFKTPKTDMTCNNEWGVRGTIHNVSILLHPNEIYHSFTDHTDCGTLHFDSLLLSSLYLFFFRNKRKNIKNVIKKGLYVGIFKKTLTLFCFEWK